MWLKISKFAYTFFVDFILRTRKILVKKKKFANVVCMNVCVLQNLSETQKKNEYTVLHTNNYIGCLLDWGTSI